MVQIQEFNIKLFIHWWLIHTYECLFDKQSRYCEYHQHLITINNTIELQYPLKFASQIIFPAAKALMSQLSLSTCYLSGLWNQKVVT